MLITRVLLHYIGIPDILQEYVWRTFCAASLYELFSLRWQRPLKKAKMTLGHVSKNADK